MKSPAFFIWGKYLPLRRRKETAANCSPKTNEEGQQHAHQIFKNKADRRHSRNPWISSGICFQLVGRSKVRALSKTNQIGAANNCLA